jgi:RHS repeat-associated protein
MYLRFTLHLPTRLRHQDRVPTQARVFTRRALQDPTMASPSRRISRLAIALVGLLLATLFFPCLVTAQEQVEYYGADAVGSMRIVFDAAGSVVARTDFEPFGASLTPASPIGATVYATLFRDAEVNADDATARMYQYRTAHFMSVDPLAAGLYEPQRWNRYAYALNNPLAYVDTSGMNAQSCPVDTCSEVTAPYPDSFMWWFLSGLGWNGGGGGNGSGAGGGSDYQGRGQGGTNTPTVPAKPAEAGPARTHDPCDPITLEGCAPPVMGEALKVIGQSIVESVKTLVSKDFRQSCAVEYVNQFAGNLFPLAPSLSTWAEPVAQVGTAINFNRALRYAASQPNAAGGVGLMYPYKSSVFRALVGEAEWMATKGTALLGEGFAMAEAYKAEAEAFMAGRCR